MSSGKFPFIKFLSFSSPQLRIAFIMILQFILETEIISVLLSHISRFIVVIDARDRKEILRNLIMRF